MSGASWTPVLAGRDRAVIPLDDGQGPSLAVSLRASGAKRSAMGGGDRNEETGLRNGRHARGVSDRRLGLWRVARRESCRPDHRRGEGGADRCAERTAADHTRPRDQGYRRSRSARARGSASRRCPLYVLDFRRPCAGQVHPDPRGRRGRVPSRQPPGQQESAQHRPPCREWPGRRRGGLVDRARPQFSLLVQSAQSGALCLSLRDRAGCDACR